MKTLLTTLLSATLFSVSISADELQQENGKIDMLLNGNLIIEDISLELDPPEEIFSNGFERLGEGSLCTVDTECVEGLLCCYPCGISGCENQCTIPAEGVCPLFP